MMVRQTILRQNNGSGREDRDQEDNTLCRSTYISQRPWQEVVIQCRRRKLGGEDLGISSPLGIHGEKQGASGQ